MSKFFILFPLLCMWLHPFVSSGQRLPVTLTRVVSAEGLNASDLYALCASSQEGAQVALSSQNSGNGGRLKGFRAATANGREMEISRESCLWTLVPMDDGSWALQSRESRRYLSRRESGALAVEMADGLGVGCHWRVEQLPDGAFRLSETVAAARSLSLGESYSAGSVSYYYANYETSAYSDLRLYRYALRLADTEGDVRLPLPGERLALCDAGLARGLDGTAVDVADALLCDGRLAPQSAVAVWTCEAVAGGCFALKGRQGYLGYELQPVPEAVAWQVVRGHLCSAEDVPRYLCFDSRTESWHLLSAEAAQAGAHLVSVADTPHRTLDDRGVCSLSGGWTASDLAALDWQGVRCLDLTGVALPLHTRAFDTSPASPNLPLFVREEMLPYVPPSWTFVVSASGNDCRLYGQVELADGEAFYTDRPFRTEAGAMTYRREAAPADGWQTLCLPFEVRAEPGLLALMDGVRAGALLFSMATSVPAGVPCLVARRAGEPLTLTSAACVVAPSPHAGEALRGTFAPMQVTDEAQSVCLLSAPKGAFVRAAAGSSLPPFRAYWVWTDPRNVPFKTTFPVFLTKKKE